MSASTFSLPPSSPTLGSPPPGFGAWRLRRPADVGDELNGRVTFFGPRLCGNIKADNGEVFFFRLQDVLNPWKTKCKEERIVFNDDVRFEVHPAPSNEYDRKSPLRMAKKIQILKNDEPEIEEPSIEPSSAINQLRPLPANQSPFTPHPNPQFDISPHGPYIESNIHINFHTLNHNDCRLIAHTTQQLFDYLSICPLKFKNYAVEFYPCARYPNPDKKSCDDETWSLRIRFDVGSWFRFWKRKCEGNLTDQKQFAQNARVYFEFLCHQIQCELSLNPHIDLTKVAEIPTYCSHQGKCISAELNAAALSKAAAVTLVTLVTPPTTDDSAAAKSGDVCPKGRHSNYICSQLTSRGQKKSPCGQFVIEELHLENFDVSITSLDTNVSLNSSSSSPSTPNHSSTPAHSNLSNADFVVIARVELFREVLLMPTPGVIEHYSNQEIAVLECFWIAVYKFVRSLTKFSNGKFPIDWYVSLNFGEWASCTAANPSNRDGHAHAHVSVSREFLNLGILSSRLNGTFQSAHLPYWEKDVELLEALVLNLEMIVQTAEMNRTVTELRKITACVLI